MKCSIKHYNFIGLILLLQVSQAKPLKMQSEIMVEEMMNSEEFEYSPKGLPMLLHQVSHSGNDLLLYYKLSIIKAGRYLFH